MTVTRRCLIIEDEDDDAMLLLQYLRDDGFVLDQKIVKTRADVIAALGDPWDFILCDYHLPGYTALDVLKWIKERHIEVPVIVTSGAIGDEAAIETIHAGAVDYLLKDRLARLGVAVCFALDFRESQQTRKNILTMIHHEFRTPLTLVRGFVTILREPGLSDAERSSIIDSIERGADRTWRLIQNFLMMSDILSGEAHLVYQKHGDVFTDWNRIVMLVAARYRDQLQRTQVGLRTSVAEHLPPILAVADHIETIIDQLVSNAVKFTPKGLVAIKVEKGGTGVVLSVTDTGIGIEVDDLSRIFSPLVQIDRDKREQQGAGLGLAIVKGLVEGHGGCVTVKSAPDRGSLFTATFPIIHE